jgi:hypothetical protein
MLYLIVQYVELVLINQTAEILSILFFVSVAGFFVLVMELYLVYIK